MLAVEVSVMFAVPLIAASIGYGLESLSLCACGNCSMSQSLPRHCSLQCWGVAGLSVQC